MSPETALTEIQARLLGDSEEMLTDGQMESVLFVLRQFYRIFRNEFNEKIGDLEGQLERCDDEF